MTPMPREEGRTACRRTHRYALSMHSTLSVPPDVRLPQHSPLPFSRRTSMDTSSASNLRTPGNTPGYSALRSCMAKREPCGERLASRAPHFVHEYCLYASTCSSTSRSSGLW